MKCQPDVVLNQFDSSDFESVFVNVTSSPGKSVLIGAIYRPPGGDIDRFNGPFRRGGLLCPGSGKHADRMETSKSVK